MDFENSNTDTRYSTPKRKVLGDLSNGSPVSPMANLRLLTKVATSPVQTELPDECVLEDQCNWPNKITPCSDTCGKKNFEYGYVRRTKSLSVLCEKFLTLFPLDIGDEESRSISIKHMAIELGVEKRRVYDIVNIVESLDMARKFAKDSYIWFGNQNVPTKVASLHKYALTVGLDKLVEEISEGKNISSDISPLSLFSMDERRIGVLCQKFVMLLLVCHNKLPVTLDMATSILTGGSEPNKTKSRRLYDISNMLLALGIVKKLKTEVPNNPFKKPAFVYSGPCYDLQYKSDVCEHPEGEQDRSSLTTVSCQTEIVLPASVEVPKQKDKLNLSTSPVSWISIKKPIAKKRLVFNQDLNIVFKPVAENVIHKKFDLKTCKPLGSIVLHRPKAKLEPGSLYKAVKVGGAMQLVKIP